MKKKKGGPSKIRLPSHTSVIAIVRSYPVSSSFLLYFGNAFANSHHCELLAAAFGPGPLGLQWHSVCQVYLSKYPIILK